MADVRKVLGSMVVAVLAVSMLFAQPASADDVGDEGAFLTSLNDLRASKGLGALASNGDLTAVARAWSARMAAAGTISHNPALADQSPSTWVGLGENVGVGTDVATLHDAFVASAAHYKNMVGASFTSVGIGVVRDGGGRIFVTADFMQTRAPSAPVIVQAAAPPTPAPAPAPVVARAPVPAPAPKPASAPAPAPAVPAAVEPVVAPTSVVPTPVAPVPAPVVGPVAAPVVVPVTSPDSRTVTVTMVASPSSDSPGTTLVLVGIGLLLTVAASALVVPRRAAKAPAFASRY